MCDADLLYKDYQADHKFTITTYSPTGVVSRLFLYCFCRSVLSFLFLFDIVMRFSVGYRLRMQLLCVLLINEHPFVRVLIVWLDVLLRSEVARHVVRSFRIYSVEELSVVI